MGLPRANWLERQPTRSKMTAILKAIKSGMLSQMPRTALPFGLSRACSTAAELHKALRRQKRQKMPSTARVRFGRFGFLMLMAAAGGNRPCELRGLVSRDATD